MLFSKKRTKMHTELRQCYVTKKKIKLCLRIIFYLMAEQKKYSKNFSFIKWVYKRYNFKIIFYCSIIRSKGNLVRKYSEKLS